MVNGEFLKACGQSPDQINVIVVQRNQHSAIFQVTLQNEAPADSSFKALNDCLMFGRKAAASFSQVIVDQGWILP